MTVTMIPQGLLTTMTTMKEKEDASSPGRNRLREIQSIVTRRRFQAMTLQDAVEKTIQPSGPEKINITVTVKAMLKLQRQYGDKRHSRAWRH